MRFPRFSRSLVLALAAVAGACSDSPTGPRAPLALSEVLEEMSLSTLIPGGIGAGSSVPAAAAVPTGCVYGASVQSFVCAPVTVHGVTVTQGYTLLTGAGTPQPAFDPATTAAVRSTMTAVGTVVEDFVSDIDMQQTMTLSGLLTGTHVLDGTQLLTLSTRIVGAGTFRNTITTTIAGLVLPERGPRNFARSPYPRAGSITLSLVAQDTDINPGPIVIRMEFNGTSKVAVTITSGGRTERCTIDLAASGPAGSTCFDF